MAEKVEEKPVSVDSICLSTQTDCSLTQSADTHTVSSAQLGPEELYKLALQFYKGRRLTVFDRVMLNTAGEAVMVVISD